MVVHPIQFAALTVLLVDLICCTANGFDALAAASNPTVKKRLQAAQLMMTETPGYSFPQSLLHAGVVYKGGNWRLRRLLLQAAAGEPVHIGLLGGSVSCGHSVNKSDIFQAVFANRLGTLFPEANITIKNGCASSTQSSFAATCTKYAVREDAQLVFVEFAINDAYQEKIGNPHQKAMERLVRRLHQFKLRPHVVIFNVVARGQAYWRNPKLLPHLLSVPKAPFWQTPDEYYGMIAQYYGTAWLSMRDSVWHEYGMRNNSTHNYSEIMAEDSVHPNTLGHKMMADIGIALVQQTLDELLGSRPYGPEDELEFNRPLDVPIFEGNHPPMSVTCAWGLDLPNVVTSHPGWDFINESKDPHKRKWGFVTNKTDTSLLIQIDTRGQVVDGSAAVSSVQIAHLRSYEHMGQARVACVSGCRCNETIIEAHNTDYHTSQIYMAGLVVTSVPECVLSITVLNTTKSGEHKFRVASVLVTWDQYTGFEPHHATEEFESTS